MVEIACEQYVMKNFALLVVVIGAALGAYWAFQKFTIETGPYYEIVNFHEGGKSDVIRRIKPSELPSAAGVVKPPEYELTKSNPKGEVIETYPRFTGRAAIAIFAARYHVAVLDNDGKFITTINKATSIPGTLDVILVLDQDNNIVVDKDGEPIFFDAARISELRSGPLPEPGIKWVALSVDSQGNLLTDSASNPIPCGESIGAPMAPGCKYFTVRKHR